MVRTCIRKSNRGSWDLKQMNLAAEAVRSGELSVREASATFGVPKSTLERHLVVLGDIDQCLTQDLNLSWLNTAYRCRIGYLD